MGRPRSATVNEELRECSEHGVIAFRVHKVGMRAGVQRFRARCPKCHSAKNMKKV